MSTPFSPKALSEFARYYGFHYARVDPSALVQDIHGEMERGLRGQASSLSMIPAHISPVSRTMPGKTVIALDAGGTNLRAALVTFNEDGKAVATDSRKAPMPGTSGPVGADAFFDGIAALAAPLMKGARVEGIGFCFSYPMEMTSGADGILTAFSKEVDAPQVVGMSIGAELGRALARRNVPAPERIVVLNDTTAALLSGLSQLPCGGEHLEGGQSGPLTGVILGTGFNTAYPEKRIPKIGFDSPDSPQIVVCETGGFAHRYAGPLDREFDSATKNPGAYTLEKATAGAYLGPLTFHILKQALRDGLFSFDRQDEFLSWPALHTKDLNTFLCGPFAQENPIGELFGSGDRDALLSVVYLASIVTGRAALLAAAAIAATVEKAGAGADPLTPARIVVEGTTYLAYKGMRSALESNLHVLLNRNGPCPFVIAPVEQASLFGAAVAALS
ncbi:MAG: hexokinase [Treponema sp.]|nr:hexokinase [Treponema sp.]